MDSDNAHDAAAGIVHGTVLALIGFWVPLYYFGRAFGRAFGWW